MENKDIINFSKFFESSGKTNTFKREDFSDFFVNDNETETENESKSEIEFDPSKIFKIEEPELQEPFDPPIKPEEFVIDEEDPEELDFEESLPEPKHKIKENVSNDDFYAVYKDKSENFSCDVLVEGASINDTQARLILESDDWTLMFEGDIDRNGKCTIPIKKLNILNEGTMGRIRLEVIADNTVFIPWEDDFKVKMSKRVTVQVNEGRRNQPVRQNRESNVKVKLR
jgi:hypothetical protein